MSLLTQLREVLPERAIVSDASALAAYAGDEAKWIQPGQPAAAVLPETTEQVSAVLRVAHGLGVSVVPRGAGTGLSGGAVASDGSLVVSLTRMCRIVEVDEVRVSPSLRLVW